MTKILIAEDERDIRDLVVFTLQFGGFEVVAVGNGAELVSAAPTEKPDLILTDVRMPKMTGYEACQALKANAETKDIPIVFLSAKGQEEEVGLGMQAGATAYILKPFAPDVLLSKVKEILADQASDKPKAAAPASQPPAPAPSTTSPSMPPREAAPAPAPAPTASTPAPAAPAPAPAAPAAPAPVTPPAPKPPEQAAPAAPVQPPAAPPAPAAPVQPPAKDTPSGS